MTAPESRIIRSALFLPIAFVPPRTLTEQKLADIWCTVLHMDCIGIDDNYFDLGGDSIMAAGIFGMMLEEFRVTVPVASIIDAPTIAQLAHEIDRASGLPG